MKTQKELKELYKENLKLAWDDPKMVEFCSKQAEQVVETEDGWLIEVERQNIKKHFCFGYGMYLNSTPEEEEFADRQAENARTSTKHFIDENLEEYNRRIKNLKEHDAYVSLTGHYYSQKPGCKLQHYTCDYGCHYGSWNENLEDTTKWKKLSENDKNELIAAFERAKESLLKRLNTYLKKYGLSKLSVWTYLVD